MARAHRVILDGFTANTQNLAERFRVVKDKLEEIDGMKLDNELLAPTWAALRDACLLNAKVFR